jgi:glycine/D-amino acid oxidase-like deaminating enzyme
MDTHQLPPDAGRSWWLHDALAADPGEPAPPLSGDTAADVVILGGGYTGMWTAFFLKEAEPDLDIVLLEQDICGGGPSGRNGGFVNSWWGALAELCRRFGQEPTLRSASGRGKREGDRRVLHGEQYRRLVPTRRGHRAASSGPDRLLGEQRHGRRRRASPTCSVEDRQTIRELIDTPRLHGGIYTAMGATVQLPGWPEDPTCCWNGVRITSRRR